MAELRVRVLGEDDLSPELENVSQNLDMLEKKVEASKEGTESLTKTMEKWKVGIQDTNRNITWLMSDLSGFARSLLKVNIITQEQYDEFSHLKDVISLVSDGIDTLMSVQESFSGVLKAFTTTAGKAQEGMKGVTTAADAASTSMAMLAAKIAIVVGAGIALGVVFSTLVLGIIRMIKYGESFGEAFSKSFEFSMGAVKRFGSAIGDLVSSLGGAEKAESKLRLTVTEVAEALKNQEDVVKPKTMSMMEFILTCKAAGATEEQLAQASEEARITFEKQIKTEDQLKNRVDEVRHALQNQRDVTKKKGESLEEFVEICKEANATEEQLAQAAAEGKITFQEQAAAIEENATVMDSFISDFERAQMQEIWFGASAEETAKKIGLQQKVTKGKLETMESYRGKLLDVLKDEQAVSDIIEKGIWPWEKQKKAVEENIITLVKYNKATGLFEQVQYNVQSQKREEEAEWLKATIDCMAKITEDKKKQLEYTAQQTSELSSQLAKVKELQMEMEKLLAVFSQAKEAYYNQISKMERSAELMKYQLTGSI